MKKLFSIALIAMMFAPFISFADHDGISTPFNFDTASSVSSASGEILHHVNPGGFNYTFKQGQTYDIWLYLPTTSVFVKLYCHPLFPHSMGSVPSADWVAFDDFEFTFDLEINGDGRYAPQVIKDLQDPFCIYMRIF